MLPIQSLHLPLAGLGSGSARCKRTVAFPDFEQIRCAVSERNAQLVLGILCSILLSYADVVSPSSLVAGSLQTGNLPTCTSWRLVTLPTTESPMQQGLHTQLVNWSVLRIAISPELRDHASLMPVQRLQVNGGGRAWTSRMGGA